MEEPSENTAFLNQHIEELIACNRKVVFACIANRNAERNVVRMHEVHRCQSFLVGTVGSTIAGNPLLLTFCVIPLVGLGVGLFRRLLNV